MSKSRSFALAWAVALLVASTVAHGQVGYSTAKKEYSKGFKQKSLAKRKAAIAKFARSGHPEVVRDLLKDLDATVKRLAKDGKQLKKLGDKLDAERMKRMSPYIGKPFPRSHGEMVERALEPIRQEISEVEQDITRNEEVRDALGKGLGTAVATLGGENRTKALELLTLGMEKSKKPGQRVEIVRAMGFVDHELVRSALIEAVFRESNAAARVAALDALRRKPHESASKAAVQGLKDEFWQVRSSALRLLREVGGKESIGPLIDYLGREEGRLIDEAIQTLNHLTKVNFHDNAALWKDWWAKNGSKYEGRGAKGGIPGTEKAGDVAKSGDDGSNAKGTYFYGIRTRSKNIIYVLDISGSMNWAMSAEADINAHRGGGNRPADAPEGERKIDDAVVQLVQSVAGLPDDGQFNIVLYADGVKTYKKKMVTSSKKNKATLRKWAKSVKAIGATNIFEALEKAFQVVGRGTFDKKYKVTADTVYFLSDGVPTVGRTLEPAEILKQVSRWNELQQVKVHTVGLGKSIDPDFMKSLAEQTGGQFVHKK